MGKLRNNSQTAYSSFTKFCTPIYKSIWDIFYIYILYVIFIFHIHILYSYFIFYSLDFIFIFYICIFYFISYFVIFGLSFTWLYQYWSNHVENTAFSSKEIFNNSKTAYSSFTKFCTQVYRPILHKFMKWSLTSEVNFDLRGQNEICKGL